MGELERLIAELPARDRIYILRLLDRLAEDARYIAEQIVERAAKAGAEVRE